MANIQDFSGRVIDYAERLSDMADAAQGKGSRRAGTSTRWLILPAAGAGLFALVRSDFFTRQAKEVVEQAKTRASDLPDELLSQVRQTSQKPSRNGSQGRRTSTARRTSGSPRKTNRSSNATTSRSAKTRSSRKTSSSAS